MGFDDPSAVPLGASCRRTANTGRSPVVGLRTTVRVPNLVMGDLNADPMLAIGGQLRSGLQPGQAGRYAHLACWVKRQHLQERLRALVSYSYGTESGVSEEAPPIHGESDWPFSRFMIIVGVISRSRVWRFAWREVG